MGHNAAQLALKRLFVFPGVLPHTRDADVNLPNDWPRFRIVERKDVGVCIVLEILFVHSGNETVGRKDIGKGFYGVVL